MYMHQLGLEDNGGPDRLTMQAGQNITPFTFIVGLPLLQPIFTSRYTISTLD